MDCIFCRIIAGEIPCRKIAENDTTLAFLDIQPISEGHTLVIPKHHCRDLWDARADDLSEVIRMVQQVATQLERTLHPDGLNIVQNNRPAAGQVVLHYHVHLIPRRAGDGVLSSWKPLKPSDHELDSIAARIRALD